MHLVGSCSGSEQQGYKQKGGSGEAATFPSDEVFHPRKQKNRNSNLPSLQLTLGKGATKRHTYLELTHSKRWKTHIFAYILDPCYLTAPFPLPFPRQCGIPGHHSSAKYRIINRKSVGTNILLCFQRPAFHLLTYVLTYLPTYLPTYFQCFVSMILSGSAAHFDL